MFQAPPLEAPGLLVTGTDTGVGKTVVTCAIAASLRRSRRAEIGVCKPFGSGCRREREGLVHEDAEALAHFADCRLPLDVINPVRFREPLAPAVAAEQAGESVDWDAIARSLSRLDAASDALLVEGVGGLLVPLDPRDPQYTVLDFAVELGYPAVVVCRGVLGTLNHSAMTVRLLREAGVAVAGLVINALDVDAAVAEADPSIKSNKAWLEKLTGAKVLAVSPRAEATAVQRGELDRAVLDAVGQVDWWKLLGRRGG